MYKILAVSFIVFGAICNAEDDGGQSPCRGLFSWFSSSASSAASYEAVEAISVLSFNALGCGKLVQKVAIPLNEETPDYQPKGWGNESEIVRVQTLDGVIITGNWSGSWYGGSDKTMIMFHGNGMNADRYEPWAKWFNQKGYNALAFTIQGYPGSGGSSANLPVASALLVEAAFRFATQEKKIPLSKIVVYGFSLGGGYATYAGRYFDVPVILQNTLTSISDIPANIVGKYFPKMIGRALEKSYKNYQDGMPALVTLGAFESHGSVPLNSFDNVENLQHIQKPKMILYGENDVLMGKENRALQLYQAAYGKDTAIDPDLFVKIPGGSHTDVFLGNTDIEIQVAQFLIKNLNEW